MFTYILILSVFFNKNVWPLKFVRRIIRHSLEYLAQGDWNEEEVKKYSKILSDYIVNANQSATAVQVPLGLQLHVVNMFPEELAKVLLICWISHLVAKLFD